MSRTDNLAAQTDWSAPNKEVFNREREGESLYTQAGKFSSTDNVYYRRRCFALLGCMLTPFLQERLK